ncbi:MAG: type IV toxin-antitoxin system AbiEi family antitoxin domain-containing protein [Solirubrobacterales bacterium]
MRKKVATPDAAAANIAARQHGVVSLRQLRAVGMTESGVRRRVEAGHLHRIHRGVYAVGHTALSHHGRWMAAVLACGGNPPDPQQQRGPSAVLSHRSAAMLWGLLPPQAGVVDVSALASGGRAKRRGIRLHRPRSLLPEQITRRSAIPVTIPARTLDDLQRVVPAEQHRRAIRQAAVLGLASEPVLIHDGTRSELERLFLRHCRKCGLPAPEVNVRIDSMEVDFLWRDRRLIVETDGYRYHRGRAAFEDDRNRDLKLRALGYSVIRLTYRQVVEQPQRITDALRHYIH